jgi:transposase
LSKECPECLQYKKRIEDLEEELAYVKFELEELRSKRYKSGKSKRPDTQPPAPPVPKKRGGLFGHIGWFRRKPERIDKTVELKICECPECGSKDLSECEKTEEHVQEDIILPRIEATRYRRHYYYCKSCKKVVSLKGSSELIRSRIGPTAKSLAVFLRYAVKISERDVKALFEKAFGLRISASSIAGFRTKLKEEALPLYEKLLEMLRKGRFIHADETGWKVDGDNYWLWKFSNKKVSLSHIDPSRGQTVVANVIGDKYDGVIISDFLSAYNKIDAKAKQRCLVHILRDLRKVMECWHDDMEVMGYCLRLKKILTDAMELHNEYKNKRRDESYRKRRESLKTSLDDFAFPNPNKRILARFVKRLERHKNEMLTFLYERGIDYHNNHAEQQIRPDVIFRKITFGNRSLVGAQNHSVIMSILQTAKLNGIDPLTTLGKILLRSPENPLAKALSP